MAYANPNLLPATGASFEGGAHAIVAGANTTLLYLPAGGGTIDGVASVKLTATAAGSINCTGPRFLVTAGTGYVARHPLRTGASAAARTATLTITWYNATSGGTSLGTSTSGALPLGTVSGWYQANYPVAFGQAPAGALSATLTLTVTGAAAAEQIYIDQIYAGQQSVRVGNLFDFNTAWVERDVSGWKADTNASLARLASEFVSTSGYYVLEATSLAAGLVDIRPNLFYDVVAGTSYSAYAAVTSPDVAVTWSVQLRWYDAAWNDVGTPETRALPVAIGATERAAVVGIAPAGATRVKFHLRPTATAAGQHFLVDDASLIVSTNLVGNLLTVDEYSSESQLAAWTIDGATSSRAYLTSSSLDGFFVHRLTPTGVGIISVQLDRLIPVTPGVTYKTGATVFRHSTSPAQEVTTATRTRLDWFGAGGLLMQADNPDQFYARTGDGDYFGHTNSQTRTAPAGAVYGKVSVELDHTSTLVDHYSLDRVLFVESVSEYDLIVDNAAGCITLALNTPPAAPYDRVTVTRMDADGHASPMRGYGYAYDLAPYTPGPMLVEDYEAPLSATVWYSVKWTSTTDSGLTTRLFTRTTQAPVLDSGDYVWFKSPGIPALNTRVMMEAPVKWSRAARSGRYDIVGRKNPLHITGVRSGRTASISILVWDTSSNELFNSLLDSGLPALIQAMPGFGMDGNTYLSVGDVDVDPLSPDAREEGWRWTLDVTEINRPEGGLQGSALSTWQTLLNNPLYPTWEDIFETHDTWTQVLTKG